MTTAAGGRIFFPPPDEDCAKELWLNIGEKGYLSWPHYPPHLSGHITESEYNSLKEEITKTIEQGPEDFTWLWAVAGGCCCLSIMGCPCACCILGYVWTRPNPLDDKLTSMVNKHMGDKAHLHHCKMAHQSGCGGIDTTGQALGTVSTSADDGGHFDHVWPPFGYNIVISPGHWGMPDGSAAPILAAPEAMQMV